MKKRIVSGIKPSGSLTLGNYIGAAKQFVDLQNEFDSFVFVADLHAITVPQNSTELRARTYDLVKLYLAMGLDPKKTTLFIQSEVPAHLQLAWVFTCSSYMGELERMTQYKDTVLKNKVKQLPIGSGILQYPPLMAADILLYDPQIVPVGDDQSQHLELTRTLAERLNGITNQDIFTIPETFKPKQGARIMSLQEPTKKMSKSDDNPKSYIALLDPIAVSVKKIKSAVTDSEMVVRYDVEHKPGISNLLTIYASLENIEISDAQKHFENSTYGEFKTAVAKTVEIFLTELQNKYHALNMDTVNAILDDGRIKADAIASKKISHVYHKLGIGRF
ncbi:tryptophanyl-tRNA synthetase [Erysipelotrichaceae bacterium]|nr:tryptophanyl-tRNA synthetase [Erysipelotrichaceae bacterium]